MINEVPPGTTKETELLISEFYTGYPARIPVTTIRGQKEGPSMFITAAVHGDELNGVEIVRRLIQKIEPSSLSGTLICVPIVNRFGFLAHSRYVPDRRDLNRLFPGTKSGSQASRIACRIFRNIVKPCDFGLDIHTATYGKSNLPHIRADLSVPRIKEMAKSTGAKIILDTKGNPRSLRRTAVKKGVPVIILEAGESLKFQNDIIEEGLIYVENLLYYLEMLEGKRTKPPFQVVVRTSKWLRSDKGGILDLKVRPGDLVYEKDTVAVVTNPFGHFRSTAVSPLTGMVIGVATLPLVHPGDSVCNIVKMDRTLSLVEKHSNKTGE